jgi:hypothetical protein
MARAVLRSVPGTSNGKVKKTFLFSWVAMYIRLLEAADRGEAGVPRITPAQQSQAHLVRYLLDTHVAHTTSPADSSAITEPPASAATSAFSHGGGGGGA